MAEWCVHFVDPHHCFRNAAGVEGNFEADLMVAHQ